MLLVSYAEARADAAIMTALFVFLFFFVGRFGGRHGSMAYCEAFFFVPTYDGWGKITRKAAALHGALWTLLGP